MARGRDLSYFHGVAREPTPAYLAISAVPLYFSFCRLAYDAEPSETVGFFATPYNLTYPCGQSTRVWRDTEDATSTHMSLSRVRRPR